MLSLILRINWGTELNHLDGTRICLIAAEWHCEMEITHRCATQGCCKWKENARTARTVCSSLVKQSICNSRKSCLRLTVQRVWLSGTVTTELTTCQCLMGKGTLCSCVHTNDLPVAHRTYLCVQMLQFHFFLRIIFKGHISPQSLHTLHTQNKRVLFRVRSVSGLTF